MSERIFAGSLVVQGMTLNPALWSWATSTVGLGPMRVASTGERTGVWALWAFAWALAAFMSSRKGFCIGACWAVRVAVVKRVAIRVRVRVEVRMTHYSSGLKLMGCEWEGMGFCCRIGASSRADVAPINLPKCFLPALLLLIFRRALNTFRALILARGVVLTT